MKPWKRELLRRAVVALLASPAWRAEDAAGRADRVVNLCESFLAETGALVALRNRAIRRRFDGVNVADLAAAFGLHPRQIRRIVRPRRRRK